MNGIVDQHVKRNKPDSERLTSDVLSYLDFNYTHVYVCIWNMGVQSGLQEEMEKERATIQVTQKQKGHCLEGQMANQGGRGHKAGEWEGAIGMRSDDMCMCVRL